MDIGKRVREAREARGLTQEGLARRAGVPLNRVGRIETGTVTDPHYSTLSRIAGGLDMSVGELLGEPVSAPLAEAPAGEESASGQGDERALRNLRAIATLGTRLEDRASGFLERAGPDPPWSRFLSAYEHYAGIVDYLKTLADGGVLPAPADGPLPADEESVASYILAISRRLHEVMDELSVFADQAELEVRRDNRDFWKKREPERVRYHELLRAGEAAWAKAQAG